MIEDGARCDDSKANDPCKGSPPRVSEQFPVLIASSLVPECSSPALPDATAPHTLVVPPAQPAGACDLRWTLMIAPSRVNGINEARKVRWYQPGNLSQR